MGMADVGQGQVRVNLKSLNVGQKVGKIYNSHWIRFLCQGVLPSMFFLSFVSHLNVCKF